MLVLSRKLGEKLYIGDGPDMVEVIVTSIDRGKVRLGFVAPQHVSILRKELADQGVTHDLSKRNRSSPAPD